MLFSLASVTGSRIRGRRHIFKKTWRRGVQEARRAATNCFPPGRRAGFQSLSVSHLPQI